MSRPVDSYSQQQNDQANMDADRAHLRDTSREPLRLHAHNTVASRIVKPRIKSRAPNGYFCECPKEDSPYVIPHAAYCPARSGK